MFRANTIQPGCSMDGWSSARWLIANINDGRIDGHQALPAAAVTMAHKEYATTDRDYYRFHRYGYGLGWYYSDFEGDLLMHHFGGLGRGRNP